MLFKRLLHPVGQVHSGTVPSVYWAWSLGKWAFAWWYSLFGYWGFFSRKTFRWPGVANDIGEIWREECFCFSAVERRGEARCAEGIEGTRRISSTVSNRSGDSDLFELMRMNLGMFLWSKAFTEWNRTGSAMSQRKTNVFWKNKKYRRNFAAA